ncbi:MAG: hypothetical protein LBD80_00780 [Tannerella sp.]|jgi:hypothetical protein|nr:hypothetical protein [Tannerella sp.]
MKRIIQISEKEYKELAEKASYNQVEIERLAREMYEKKGVFRIELEISVHQDYHEVISFNVTSWVSDTDRYELSYEARHKIMEYAQKKMQDLMTRKFGRQINNINLWNKRLDSLRKWKWKFIGLTVFGWLAALAILIINILN